MHPLILLVDTVEDLRSRCGLRASEYDVTQAAGLMRRLLVDGRAVVPMVVKMLRLDDPVFRSQPSFRLDSTGLLIWTMISDPDMFSHTMQRRYGGPASTGLKPHEDDLVRFLTRPVIFDNTVSVRQPPEDMDPTDKVSVRQLIKDFANEHGGVHGSLTGLSREPLIQRALNANPNFVFEAIAAMGRIVVRSLDPLCAVVIYELGANTRITTAPPAP